MDHEGLLKDLTDKTVDTIFADFMARCAKLEELADAGEGFLRGFYRELEICRRAPLCKTSSVVGEVINSNYTDKLKEYVEAGFNNRENVVKNISKLNSCKLRLEDYLIKAKAVLDELESLKHNAIDIIKHAIDDHSSDRVFNFLDDNITQQSQSVREDVQESLLLDGSMSRSTLMTIIYGMLKLEFSMQEKIIRSLNLKTSSSLFESYCLFWELRPNIDDNVMHQAWKYVSG
ncbi:uncharacterized protein LOC110114846 isoform X2 [Dendrobium catenatum]|uniref:uncharacterized protein LOC110114846 isoform X2 n=1 Tax=Dendrobium catenatum TaxID=906689 RepID=UPI0009F308A2|nr:uncharacterized protein LOC110114846 isoform X2 [Dendrobium catenatum]XP_020703526.1 uncharacterized protein LOC110114846 isoform X2 [Dendrobium catenatum]XP_020703527.1 uncharacterized protein LOC110114846 isoform X2 [Dendrobium catenatum]XP_020703528.1 uncharacterized protein LOC110114846 isoform X2 [Dendrobium catenatum]XP_028550255.1 uncharacterized protein LOC110114846 isoform X2 [Dendrobium catenatum]XP_028550256.1 uncharacterized protein LOC110114846 isoform X2 [Dendrobium catenatum]